MNEIKKVPKFFKVFSQIPVGESIDMNKGKALNANTLCVNCLNNIAKYQKEYPDTLYKCQLARKDSHGFEGIRIYRLK